MSYTVDSGLRFRPLKREDFRFRNPIKLGDGTTTPSSPFETGISDLAFNQLLLWGQSGHLIIADSHHQDVYLSAANTDYDIAAYKFPVPGYLNDDSGVGRRFLRVKVTGLIDAGTWTIKARTGAGHATTATTGTGSSPQTIDDLYVPLPLSTTTEYLILSITSSTVGATFSFQGIQAHILPVTPAVAGDKAIWSENRMWPVDTTVQVAADRPLTVDIARSLIQANDIFYRWNVRTVFNFCTIANYGASDYSTQSWALWTASDEAQSSQDATDRYLSMLNWDSEIINKSRHEWVYFPRPGIEYISVHMDGFVEGWSGTGDTASCDFRFKGGQDEVTLFMQSDNYFSAENWPINGGNTYSLKVPAGPGPHFLELRSRLDNAPVEGIVTALSVYETGGLA